MRAKELEFTMTLAPNHEDLISHAARAAVFRCADGSIPLRWTVTETTETILREGGGQVLYCHILSGKPMTRNRPNKIN